MKSRPDLHDPHSHDPDLDSSGRLDAGLLNAEPGDPGRAIARLETEIEELARSVERCGKIELAAKLLITGGTLALLAGLFGLLRLDPAAGMGALAAVIGGIVLFGSNGSTLKQTQARLEATEARRAALIGAMELRLVGGTATRH